MNWEQLARRRLSYPEIGATAGPLPDGYHHIRRERAIGLGEQAFRRAAAQLMAWEIQRRAGIRIDTSTPTAVPGSLVSIRLGPLRAACKVIYVTDEPHRQGFAYGTLDGHPESGEEYFGVRLDPDGTVYAEIVAFSRPARWWSKAGAWVATRVQKRITDRYLAALSTRP
ncbi:DUF1990 domain-containing protein [[Mycobacterium] wendilense]|uniref:DUF1990 domain-containing protein n=1 Tax=[Mycobacterium] wendilense TaxID=3064284 RepID=A0ABN9NX85_9MYCO|nr:DUF1990 domain-containing protein [Mycolicibacterium sp. MU0050]CAJ1581839.1 DUF1990 domain-containing protein [Mycolicibacterium sp. MU0050]